MATESGEQMSKYGHLATVGPKPDDDQAQWDTDSWYHVFEAQWNSDEPTWHAATPPQKETVEPIGPEAVEEVTHIWASSWEEYADQSMVAVMRLKDGRWASVDTWSDSSGYGCRDGTTWHIGETFEDVARWGLDDTARKNLGIEVPA